MPWRLIIGENQRSSSVPQGDRPNSPAKARDKLHHERDLCSAIVCHLCEVKFFHIFLLLFLNLGFLKLPAHALFACEGQFCLPTPSFPSTSLLNKNGANGAKEVHEEKSFDALSSISARTADIEAEANVLKAESEVLFERRAVLSQKVLDHGRALMTPLLEQIKDGGRNDPHKAQFKKPIDMFELAIDLEPENTEAEEELEKMRDVLEVPEEEPRPTPNHDDPYDVIIVGAGASGVGMGLMLTKVFNLDPQRVLLIERGEKVGESFRLLAANALHLTAFNNQGWTDSFDLNSVAYGTSPAYTLQTEHPTGEEYASYLHELAHRGELNVRIRTEVTALRPRRRGGFTVEVVPVIVGDVRGSTQPTVTILRSRYVIWAAGEFSVP